MSKMVGPKRTYPAIDSDEGIGHYLRRIGRRPLLRADEEISLAREIERTDITLWACMLAHPGIDEHVREVFRRNFHTKKLTDIELKRPKRLRALDLDHVCFFELHAALRKTDDAPAAFLAELTRLQGISQAARDKFVESNLRLVVSIARKRSHMMPIEDLLQEGNMGLMHAVPRFDYRRGLRFSTFASWWIRHGVGRVVENQLRLVRIPVGHGNWIWRLSQARMKLETQLGRAPSDVEAAESIDMPKSVFKNLTNGHQLVRAVSMDDPIGTEGEETRGDRLIDPGEHAVETMITDEVHARIQVAIARLPPIEADIVSRRYGFIGDGVEDEHTLRVIGDRYGVSRERIRQLETRALKRLSVQLRRVVG